MTDEEAARSNGEKFGVSTQGAVAGSDGLKTALRTVYDGLSGIREVLDARIAEEEAKVSTKDKPDAQLVCLNGHVITSTYYLAPDERREHCPDCGQPTIHACQRCGADLPGSYWDGYDELEGYFCRVDEVKAYCGTCGAAFPWAERLREVQAHVTARPPDGLATVERLCRRFHLVACQLRHRHTNRDAHLITDEYVVQDLLHALLRLDFDDVREEEWTPSYAGSASRMDFLLPDHGIVVEVKMTRSGLADKQVGEQLLLDIAHYQVLEKCKVLVCFVYDPEHRIRNAQGLVNDLNRRHDKLLVRVLIVPSR